MWVKLGKKGEKRVFNWEVPILEKIAKVTSNPHFSEIVTTFLYKNG